MKFISFNINGIRARIPQLTATVAKHSPDVIGLQETKVHDTEFPLEAVESLGYKVFYFGQKSHYGVALLCKREPEAVQYGFPTDSDDAQRRLLIARFTTESGEPLTVVNGYFPQGENREHEVKYPAKRKFYEDLMHYLTSHHSPTEQIIVMGDVNISHTDADVGIGEANKNRWLKQGKCSFLPEERDWLNTLLNWGLNDSFRSLYPAVTDQFSWFDYRSRGFDDNRGLRIDLILATSSLHSNLRSAGIDYGLRGLEKPSDHAPIWAEYAIS